MALRSPFGPLSTAEDVLRGHDLSAKTVVVTGAASGIGIETVRALAVAGAGVTLAVRNVEAGRSVVRSLEAEHPGARLNVVEVDLASLSSIHHAAEIISERLGVVDILINNAGVMATPFARTAEGYELQFGTNHVGHFALTMGLRAALSRSGAARVVSLSSSGHRLSAMNWSDPNYELRPYDRWAAYGQSKTANALFAVAITDRFSADGIVANAVMPGGIMTGLQKHLSFEDQRAAGFVDEHGAFNARFKNVAQGAATSVWAAVGTELEGVGGLYLENCGEASVMDPTKPYEGYMPWALDRRDADRLWGLSLDLTRESVGDARW